MRVPRKLVAAFVTLLALGAVFSTGYARKIKPVHATVIDVSGDWRIDGDLPRQALLISLEGVVNKTGPKIYLLTGKKYPYTNVATVLQYYVKKHGVVPTRMDSLPLILKKFAHYLKGYIVWDKNVRTSLIVSFTLAGLEDGVVISEKYIPLAKKLGLKQIEDFRGKFEGQSDLKIYQWAYKQYWPRCSKEYITFIGGVGGVRMQPAIADFGIYHKTFFSDLSSRDEDAAEQALVSKMYSEMKPFGLVLGWHPYYKDLEEEYVKLASNHLLRVEGLNTIPNLSFHCQIPASPGFKFKQKHRPNLHRKIEKKVYITLIQSDGLGIGAWLRPGRGQIPYGWEVIMNWFTMAPAMLQFYYEQATPNDCFIGALGGAGYMYPKAVPKDKLPAAIRLAKKYMDRLDLHIFEMYDGSEPERLELPKYVVDDFYKNMPEVYGFFNGYWPTFTFDCRNGKPFVSYDYYLSARTSLDEAVNDIRELARLNPKRPYFLAFHVRQNNDVSRVKGIMDKLGPEYEIVAPDEFLVMAGKACNFTRRFEEPLPADFSGEWKLDKKLSKNIGIYASSKYRLAKRIKQIRSHFEIETISQFSHTVRHSFLSIDVGGPAVQSLDRLSRMGFLGAQSDSIETTLQWGKPFQTLVFRTKVNLETSQGTFPLKVTSTYRISENKRMLIVEEKRSSQPEKEPAVFVFRKQLLSR